MRCPEVNARITCVYFLIDRLSICGICFVWCRGGVFGSLPSSTLVRCACRCFVGSRSPLAIDGLTHRNAVLLFGRPVQHFPAHQLRLKEGSVAALCASRNNLISASVETLIGSVVPINSVSTPYPVHSTSTQDSKVNNEN